MQEVQNITNLIYKYLKDELTEEESNELMDWRNQSPENQSIFDRLTDAEMLRSEIKEMLEIEDTIWQKLVQRVPELDVPPPAPIRRMVWWKYAGAAAAVLIVIVTAYFIFRPVDKKQGTAGTIPSTVVPAPSTDSSNNRISPAGHHALLTLANKQTFQLNDTIRGHLSQQAGITIAHQQPGMISYSRQAENLYGTGPVQELDVISTPAGGQYSIVLADGTKAWLNTAAALRYPAVFTDSVRDLYVTGEVYFEVATVLAADGKKIPFRVHLQGKSVNEETVIDVLGTHFNVNANNDKSLLKATLLEGSITIRNITDKNIRNSKSVKLFPRQQAILDRKGNFVVKKNVDTAAIVSWTKGRAGFFEFDNASFEEVMGEISRWYKVEVLYKNKKKLPVSVTNSIPRNHSIDQVIEALNLIDGMQVILRRKGRIIIVLDKP